MNKRIAKVLRYFSISISSLIIVIALVAIAFLNFSPQFGGVHTEEDLERFSSSKNYENGVFVNQVPTKSTPSLSDLGKLWGFLTAETPEATPKQPLKTLSISKSDLNIDESQTKFFWFGHSAIYLQIEGKHILFDPMLSEVPAPHPWLGSKRFFEDLPIEIEHLPKIDAVILSHDHYDHLDYESIEKLKSKVGKFYTPLGVGTHLKSWGIPEEDIVELDWWESTTIANLTFVATPARHFSGRGLSDSRKTLWASWVIQSPRERIYFSGDSGYSGHFKEIGSTYGPFDLAFMECGQYNDSLPEFPIHMLPEETVQAALDVKAKHTMPIHWAAFKLNQHPWKEPAERFTKKAQELNMSIVTPEIGQLFYLSELNQPPNTWWR